FRRLSLHKRRAQALAHSAAFELTKYGQSPTYSLCAASAAAARELISCRNCGGCPVNSPSAMKLLIAPVASSCPGPVGRMIAHAGRLGLMNWQGSGMIRLDCNVSGWPVVRSSNVTVELLIGSTSVNGVALPALSCQV